MYLFCFLSTPGCDKMAWINRHIFVDSTRSNKMKKLLLFLVLTPAFAIAEPPPFPVHGPEVYQQGQSQNLNDALIGFLDSRSNAIDFNTKRDAAIFNNTVPQYVAPIAPSTGNWNDNSQINNMILNSFIHQNVLRDLKK